MLLPSLVESQIRQGVADYLRTTFPITTPHFSRMLDGLIDGPGELFKGPYVSLSLPFKKGSGDKNIFPKVPLPFPPYMHQELAFARLGGEQPKSTIVATGTGSGKTESFLWPILAYCASRAPSQGIKAILIYPMNALATDQAKRLAKTIWKNPNLKGLVTAGLYVGGEEKNAATTMGAETVITDRETLRESPSDILLTNYKMLDYLLQRPNDKPLWSTTNAGTFRFLVVDELHTFDGAQGTDLACLIRRLKHRVGLIPGQLCCIGTSATLGNADDTHTELLAYAANIFGESFDRDSVISEIRQDVREFLAGSFVKFEQMPGIDQTNSLAGESAGETLGYLSKQMKLWFKEAMAPEPFEDNGWRIKLGKRLKELPLFRSILEVLKGHIRPMGDVLQELGSVYREFGEKQDGSQEEHQQYRIALLMSLFSLASAARTEEGSSILPFVQVRIQTWLRELRRMVAEVSTEPRMRFAADLSIEQQENHLPVVHCRECGAAGWVGIRRRNNPNSVRGDLKEFYPKFFANRVSSDVTFLFPGTTDDFTEGSDYGIFQHICCNCLEVNPHKGPCNECGSNTVLVFIPSNKRTVKREDETFIVGTKDCPACGTRSSLMLIGAQAASLGSVAINQLFASKFNGDKKLLAFSDNVQDASHRVGFFSARTWRFNLRAAIKQYLDQLSSEVSLNTFIDGCVAYWRKTKGDADFVATFTPRDMMWMEAFERLVEHNDETLLPDFIEKVSNRMGWEIFAEFGFDCRRGRTLEKSGAATLLPMCDLVGTSLTLTEKLENEHEHLRGAITPDLVQRFLLGIVEHARQNGAIFNPVLEAYIARDGEAYMLWYPNKWMPKYGPNMKLPGFFAEQKNHYYRSQFESWGDTNDWIHRWTVKCFEQCYPLIENSVLDILHTTFDILHLNKLFASEEIDNNRIWGMVPTLCRITPKVIQLKCSRCGHQISMAQSYGETANGLQCFKAGCNGSYSTTDARRDYYDELYRHGDIVRLFAEEHTGLLKRDNREEIEQKFKTPEKNRKSWYPNLLSCTPTLELGIDIGDLSSVLMCSVPPAQASYLQRMGRAGRTDGNAIGMTIARGMPHDLYFYEDPMEMMEGTIATPGVYLGAMTVLERQLTAFCLDCWVHETSSANIPHKIADVFTRVEKNRTELFPLCFYEYIQKNRSRLSDQFCSLFGDNLTTEIKTYLVSYLEGGDQAPLVMKIFNEIKELRENRDALKKKLEIVRRKLDKTKNDPAASLDEKESLSKESIALGALISSINEKETLNFFTDAGLIPNYAFPETGVILRSIIYRKKEHSPGGGWDTKEYEYQRAASAAISDLVPGNMFYANGRHVRINQVDVSLSQPEDWRFCPSCNHMELVVSTDPKKECPRCNAQGWFDGTQVQSLLKVRQVFANTSERESLTRDDDDEREKHFFIRHLFVDFDFEDIEGAWSIENEDVTFGFEFIRKTTFREINFGEQTNDILQGITIAGEEYPKTGFRICRHCGTVQKRNAEKPEHANFCSARDKGNETNFEHMLYLYREFKSESIRFLIPAVTDGAERKIQSFLAALMMGLREHFRGDIDHLATSIYDEPVPYSSQQRKRYVVLFDTVPGGTGYLKQITQEKELVFGILEKALRRMQGCSCHRDSSRDGCYRCLLVYRNSRLMDKISREAAEELLTIILRNRENIKKIHALSGITMNMILESELEKKFIAALDDNVKKEGGTFCHEMRDNKPCYRLEFKGGNTKWLIEPQVEIKTQDKSEILCRADFIFHPIGFDSRKIVVFTDGLAYHKDRIGLDMRQRMALLHHPENYLTWSLSWKDIDQFEKASAYDTDFNLLQMSIAQKEQFSIFSKQLKALVSIAPADKSSMYWLFDYIKKPDGDVWQRSTLARTLALMTLEDKSNPARTERIAGVKSLVPDKMSAELEENAATIAITNQLNSLQKSHLIQTHKMMDNTTWPNAVQSVFCLNNSSTEGKDFEGNWNEFLRLVNLYQFLPWSAFLSRRDLDTGEFDDVSFAARSDSDSDKVKYSQEWDAAYAFITNDSVRLILDDLRTSKSPVPVVGFELADSANRICAMAELAWEKLKIAYLLDEKYTDQFKSTGWRVFKTGDEAILIKAVKG